MIQHTTCKSAVPLSRGSAAGVVPRSTPRRTNRQYFPLNTCQPRRGRRQSSSSVQALYRSVQNGPFPQPASSAFVAPPPVRQFDFLVIGSGIAGLTYALKTAQYGNVAIITKDYANESCTKYAQGGICAVLDKTDSVQDHVYDTIVAGAFLNDNK